MSPPVWTAQRTPLFDNAVIINVLSLKVVHHLTMAKCDANLALRGAREAPPVEQLAQSLRREDQQHHATGLCQQQERCEKAMVVACYASCDELTVMIIPLLRSQCSASCYPRNALG